MNSEIELSIIDRVKTILQIEGENSPLDLLVLLRKHRNNFHPDFFTDDEAKEEAQSKFIEIDSLIKELDAFIQRERINKSPMELAMFQPLYENSSLQSKIDELKSENDRLKSNIEALEYQIEQKENEIQIKQKEEIESKQKDLINIYKPSNNKVFSLSIVLVLSGIIPILTKIESISNIISKYAPFSRNQIDLLMFCIFVGVILISVIKYLEYKGIKNKISKIKTPIYISRFFVTLKNKQIFTENDVYDYISGKNTITKSISILLGLKSYSAETINNLKDVFIYNLISKDLITIACAGNLDRYFRVKEMPQYYNNLL